MEPIPSPHWRFGWAFYFKTNTMKQYQSVYFRKLCGLFVILIIISSTFSECHGQKGLFTFKDSSEYELTIRASSKDQLFFDDGITMDISKIQKVKFYQIRKGDRDIIELLKSNGIEVELSKEIPDDMYSSSVPSGNGVKKNQDSQSIELALKRFQSERSGAKMAELFGALGLLTNFILQNQYINEVKSGNSKAKAPPIALPIAASGLLTIGIALDIGAGGHLKFKK
jgi:hypothetical protein